MLSRVARARWPWAAVLLRLALPVALFCPLALLLAALVVL
jgi:hypothetical protein